MREIQDMTLNVSRGLERLDGRFSRRAEAFPREFYRLEEPALAWGVRVTGCPVGEDLPIEHLYGTTGVLGDYVEPWRVVWRGRGDAKERIAEDAPLAERWRPILRGARADHAFSRPAEVDAYREIRCDGLGELGCMSCVRAYNGRHRVVGDLPVFLFANAL